MHINNQPVYVAETTNSEALKNWREHQYSLTDKLKEAKGSASLELISQKWIQPTWWDKYLLQVDDAPIYQREILMRHQDIVYWYARTVIPQNCYVLNPVFFKRLENESIRNLIFNNDKVQRVNIVSYPIDKQCIEYHWVRKYLYIRNEIVWIRLAQYSFENKGFFYVIELLLPELENVS